MLTVVMPAHNEEDYLAAAVRRVVDGLRVDTDPFEVLVVENGSTDRTSEVARDLALQLPEVETITLPEPDYGMALRTGMLAAPSGWVVVFDVDYIDLGFLTDARATAERTSAVIVVGSKRNPEARDGRSPMRKAITAGFTLLLRIGFGLGVSDTHGIKLIHLSALRELVEETKHSKEIFDTELVIRAERAGFVVSELPVEVKDERPPRSSILRRIPRTLLGLLSLRVTLWREGRSFAGS